MGTSRAAVQMQVSIKGRNFYILQEPPCNFLGVATGALPMLTEEHEMEGTQELIRGE